MLTSILPANRLPHSLVSALSLSSKKCPNCRAVCVLDAATHPTSSMLASLVQSLRPGAYAERLVDSERARESWQSSVLPVFMMGQVVFPGSHLRLHLFEERYRLMIRRAVESSSRFVYVPKLDRSPLGPGTVGLVVRITECEMLADGRSLIEAECVERVSIQSAWVEDGTSGLWYARISLLPDDEPPSLLHEAEPGADADAPGDSSMFEPSAAEAADAAAAAAAAAGTEASDQPPEPVDSTDDAHAGDAGEPTDPATVLREAAQQVLERLSEGQRFALQEEIGPMPQQASAFSFWIGFLVCASQEERLELLSLRRCTDRLDYALACLRQRHGGAVDGCCVS